MNDNLYDADKDYALWWLIIHMRRAVYKARAKELFRYGIRPAEAAVLFIVQTIGYRATPAEISRWLIREPHSTSGLLLRMEKKGLLRAVKDLERKNLIRIELTEKGQEVYRQSTKRESIHRVMSSLTGAESRRLRKYLQKMRDKAIEGLWDTSKPPSPPFC